jgi:hypothetical protein
MGVNEVVRVLKPPHSHTHAHNPHSHLTPHTHLLGTVLNTLIITR